MTTLPVSDARIGEVLSSGIGDLPFDEYPHWNRLRLLRAPQGFTHEEWWFAIKCTRRATMQALPFEDKEGRPFVVTMPSHVLRRLHAIDRRAATGMASVRALSAKAEIASAQDDAEAAYRARMAHNRERALRFIHSNAKAALTPELILKLQGILTSNAADHECDSGRFRGKHEPAWVYFLLRGQRVPIYAAPNGEQLEGRIARICAFANADNSNPFIHPIVRACLVQYMVGHDHPFADGNGRVARTLFYWMLVKYGYRAESIVPLSRILRQTDPMNRWVFKYVESDSNDLTYFVDNQVKLLSSRLVPRHEGTPDIDRTELKALVELACARGLHDALYAP